MGKESKIEWCTSSWNPWQGCHKVSQGCKNCYMFRDKTRYGQDPNVVTASGDKTFYAPLKWKEPKRVFTCSWSDFFIEEADEWRDEAFAIMALTPQHTYQVLTKRADRMREYFEDQDLLYRLGDECGDLIANCDLKGEQLEQARKMVSAFYGSDTGPDGDEVFVESPMPLPNVWLGVSVEDQNTADERIRLLLTTPATKRFLSIEPLLGPIDLSNIKSQIGPNSFITQNAFDKVDSLNKGYPWPGIDWVIAGGESGPNARPTHPDWIRSIRDQCQAAGVPFFFKQWGEWAPSSLTRDFTRKFELSEDGSLMYKVGKKEAGRLLDGREWNEFPKIGQ